MYIVIRLVELPTSVPTYKANSITRLQGQFQYVQGHKTNGVNPFGASIVYKPIRLIPVQDCKAYFSMYMVIRLKELTPSVPNLYIHDFAIKGDVGVGGRGGRCKFCI